MKSIIFFLLMDINSINMKGDGSEKDFYKEMDI